MEKDNKTEKLLYLVVGLLIIVAFIIILIPSKSNNAPKNEVTNIFIEKKDVSLVVGDSYYIRYFISPSSVSNTTLTFKSSNENVAIVDSSGRVNALSLGTATITVTSANGISSNCIIIVGEKETPITAISLDKEDLELNIGESYQLKLNVEPSNTTEHDFIWTSSDPSIVAVVDGKVKALKHGSALITVKSKNGRIAICNIDVGVGVETITFKEKSLKIALDGKLKLDVDIKPTNNTEKVSFSSSDASIVSVNDDGIVTGKKIGTATITAKSQSGIKDSITIIVQSKNVQIGAAINPSINNENFNEDGNILLFGSDYQGDSRKSNFKAILENVKRNGINPSLVSILGDYNTSGYDTNSSMKGLKEANSIIKEVFPNSGSLFIQGNHDDAGNIYLTKTGGYEATNYVIYVVNEDDFPWKSAKKSKVSAIANNLDKYLSNLVDLNIRKPVFFITHLPLHYSSRGDNEYAYLLVDALNKYGDKLDIFVMFGHNHSSKYDDCLGGAVNYIEKGAKMKHFASKGTTSTTIKFTYLNAGYIGLAKNTNGLVSCSGTKVTSTNVLTMTMFKIENTDILIERYSSSAKVFTTTIKRVSHN